MVDNTQQKIRIILKSYDYRLLDSAASMISATASDAGAYVRGAIPLPCKTERFCVLRGPHIDKKSREHFELVTYKRLIEVQNFSSKAIEALMSITIAPGVSIRMIQLKSGV